MGSKLGWVSAWAQLPLEVGPPGGAAPPGVWSGQDGTWGWQEAKVPPHRVLQLLPRSYCPAARMAGSLDPARDFARARGSHQKRLPGAPAYLDGEVRSGVPVPCPSSRPCGEGWHQPGPEQLTVPSLSPRPLFPGIRQAAGTISQDRAHLQTGLQALWSLGRPAAQCGPGSGLGQQRGPHVPPPRPRLLASATSSPPPPAGQRGHAGSQRASTSSLYTVYTMYRALYIQIYL